MSIPRLSEGRWKVGDCNIEELAGKFGTPLYIYDAEVIREQFANLRAALPSNVHIYYSIKANPNASIVRLLGEAAAGVEIASAAEYEVARRAGIEGERILFAGPGKTVEELEHVIKDGIGELHVESSEEIEAIESIRIPVDVSIRFNPAETASGGAMRMGGRASQFGFDEEELPEVVRRVSDSGILRFCGLHMFAGTQILDARVLVAQWRHAAKVARGIATRFRHRLRTVDLGGGLGIPYFAGDTELSLLRLQHLADELFTGLANDPLFSETRFIVEPGRFLVGPGGIYVGRVLSVKYSRGARFVILDGGMNHHLAASGNLGQVIKKDFPIRNLSRADDEPKEAAVIVGPLCTPLDTLGRNALLPTTKVGDLIAIAQSGAYGLSASPVGFLSHPVPAEVLVEGSNATLVRRRGSFTFPLGT